MRRPCITGFQQKQKENTPGSMGQLLTTQHIEDGNVFEGVTRRGSF
jgi:hypothetical protein